MRHTRKPRNRKNKKSRKLHKGGNRLCSNDATIINFCVKILILKYKETMKSNRKVIFHNNALKFLFKNFIYNNLTISDHICTANHFNNLQVNFESIFIQEFNSWIHNLCEKLKTTNLRTILRNDQNDKFMKKRYFTEDVENINTKIIKKALQVCNNNPLNEDEFDSFQKQIEEEERQINPKTNNKVHPHREPKPDKPIQNVALVNIPVIAENNGNINLGNEENVPPLQNKKNKTYSRKLFDAANSLLTRKNKNSVLPLGDITNKNTFSNIQNPLSQQL